MKRMNFLSADYHRGLRKGFSVFLKNLQLIHVEKRKIDVALSHDLSGCGIERTCYMEYLLFLVAEGQ